MPKLTMDDVDKRLNEIRARARPVERPDVVSSLLERARGRTQPTGGMAPVAPKMPRLPTVRKPKL